MATRQPPLRYAAERVPTDGPPMPALVLRIELCDFRPAIWREVCVDPGITLRQLHTVIQAAMGWGNCHLHGFAVPGSGRASRYWGVPSNRRFEPKEAGLDDDWGEPSKDDARQPLAGLLQQPEDKLLYLYDYSDDWEHVIRLRGPAQVHQPLPFLIAGQGRCPPEDCGGIPGFMDLIDAWHDPAHPERADLLDWLQGMDHEGEPGVLDEAGWIALQKAVARLQRPRRRKRAS